MIWRLFQPGLLTAMTVDPVTYHFLETVIGDRAVQVTVLYEDGSRADYRKVPR